MACAWNAAISVQKKKKNQSDDNTLRMFNEMNKKNYIVVTFAAIKAREQAITMPAQAIWWNHNGL